MPELLDSLLELNRVQVEGGIQLKCEEVDLAAACKNEIEILHLALPKTQIDFRAHRDSLGRFDSGRLCVALANLISNAARHGEPGRPVLVRVDGSADTGVLTVVNEGEEIAREVLARLYEPHSDRTPKRSGPWA